MKKTLTAILFMSAATLSANTYAIGDEVVKTAIKEAADVAKTAINKNKTQVEVSNSTLDNKVSIKQGFSAGNSGISVKGEDVSIKNSVLKNNVKIQQGGSIGNSGIQLGE